MYSVLIVNKPGVNRYPIPLLWISAKTYYEENSQFSNLWHWYPPNLNYSDYTILLSEIVNNKPTVIGFSVYVWNEFFSLSLAKDIKEQLPDTIVVFGGPQHDVKYNKNFFKENKFVDLVIPGDAYGEILFFEILNNISSNYGRLDSTKINYCYYPDADYNVVFNSLTINKKEFKWPKNPYRSQEKIIKPILNDVVHEEYCWLIIETSRGCPYKCSFCDWGGGTYTKTNKKPFSTILDEFTWVGENKINAIYITDANFGIFDIDIEYTKFLVEVNKKYGYPKKVVIQPTKAKIDNLFQIYKLLAEANMIYQYQISIQDLDDNVKKNVDRIDFSFDDQVNMFKKLQEIKYLPILIECILGMPGSSIETVKYSIHEISLKKLPFPLSHHWVLLPETPAYDPNYREKYKLVTIKGKSSAGAGGSAPIKQKINKIVENGVNSAITDISDSTSEYVIGTMSYSPNEWVDMNLLQIFTAATQNTQILDLLADYLWDKHQLNYGDFFNLITTNLLTNKKVDKKLQKELNKVKTSILNWMNEESTDIYCDYHKEFAFTLAPVPYCILVILTNIDAFFDGILLAIDQFTKIDSSIVDLCYFLKNRLIDINYTPEKKFETDYNWINYINHKCLDKRRTCYIMYDTQILAGGKFFDIDWQQYHGTINYYSHFVYRVCYDYKATKISQHLKVIQ